MKILVVSTVQSHPTSSGSAKFISSYTSLLKNLGNEVYFLHVPLVYKDTKESEQGVEESRKFWGNNYFSFRMSLLNKITEKIRDWFYKKFCNYYASCDTHYVWGLDRYVNKLDSKYHFDACLVNYYWLSKLNTKINIPKRGIITHDSFTYNNLRNNVKSNLNLMPNEEAKALQRCPYIFAMQEDEKILFQRLSPKSKVLVNYCLYEFHNQPVVGNHNLVFLSSAFVLNINGLNWFLNDIFPSIINKYPDCRLIIGGGICNVVSELSKHPNIDLIGYVDDAEDLYKQGDVAINPTYQGTGLKIKTFEAVSYNKVTMAHPHSITGIYKKSNSPVFTSVNPDEWLHFLDKIWGDSRNIEAIREHNNIYINEMNEFVISQFKTFLEE